MRDDLQAPGIAPGEPLLPGTIPLDAVVLGQLPRMAHHPPCPRHENHLVYILGHPLCLGCTCMGTGAVFGTAAMLLTSLASVSFGLWLTLHSIAVLPTVFQPWLQHKWYKMAARALVGFASATWCLGSLGLGPTPDQLSPLVWGGGALLFFVLVSRDLLALRERFTRSPCGDCPLGVFPTCEWSMERESGLTGPLQEALKDIAARSSWNEDIESRL